MKDTNTRTFTVDRGEGRAPFKFAVHTRADGAIQVTRISPYDETEYHWALKSAGRNFWSLLRSGRKVSTSSATSTPTGIRAAIPLACSTSSTA